MCLGDLPASTRFRVFVTSVQCQGSRCAPCMVGPQCPLCPLQALGVLCACPEAQARGVCWGQSPPHSDCPWPSSHTLQATLISTRSGALGSRLGCRGAPGACRRMFGSAGRAAGGAMQTVTSYCPSLWFPGDCVCRVCTHVFLCVVSWYTCGFPLFPVCLHACV